MRSRRIAIPVLAAGILLAGVACGSGEKEQQVSPEPTVQLLVGTPPPVVAPPLDDTEVEGDQGRVRAPALVALDWLEQPVEVPPLPAFVPALDDAQLLDALHGALTEAEGRVSVVVRNLEDGRYAAVNSTEVYYAASLFKLGILFESFRQADAGVLDFGRIVTQEQKYADDDLGTLELLGLHAGDTL
jgi:hypothetical protein